MEAFQVKAALAPEVACSQGRGIGFKDSGLEVEVQGKRFRVLGSFVAFGLALEAALVAGF